MDDLYNNAVDNLFNKIVQPTLSEMPLNIDEIENFTTNMFDNSYNDFPAYVIPTQYKDNMNLFKLILNARETLTYDMLKSKINYIFHSYSRYCPDMFENLQGNNIEFHQLRFNELVKKFIALYGNLPEPEPIPEPLTEPIINPNPTFEGHRFLPGGTRNKKKKNKKKRKFNSKKRKISQYK